MTLGFLPVGILNRNFLNSSLSLLLVASFTQIYHRLIVLHFLPSLDDRLQCIIWRQSLVWQHQICYRGSIVFAEPFIYNLFLIRVSIGGNDRMDHELLRYWAEVGIWSVFFITKSILICAAFLAYFRKFFALFPFSLPRVF